MFGSVINSQQNKKMSKNKKNNGSVKPTNESTSTGITMEVSEPYRQNDMSLPAMENTENHSDSKKLEIRIEKGVAIPKMRMKNKYPFEMLEPGDSFVIPKRAAQGSVTVSYWKKKLPGREFTVRTETPETCRVWRVDGMLETPKVVETV